MCHPLAEEICKIIATKNSVPGHPTAVGRSFNKFLGKLLHGVAIEAACVFLIFVPEAAHANHVASEGSS